MTSLSFPLFQQQPASPPSFPASGMRQESLDPTLVATSGKHVSRTAHAALHIKDNQHIGKKRNFSESQIIDLTQSDSDEKALKPADSAIQLKTLAQRERVNTRAPSKSFRRIISAREKIIRRIEENLFSLANVAGIPGIPLLDVIEHLNKATEKRIRQLREHMALLDELEDVKEEAERHGWLIPAHLVEMEKQLPCTLIEFIGIELPDYLKIGRLGNYLNLNLASTLLQIHLHSPAAIFQWLLANRKDMSNLRAELNKKIYQEDNARAALESVTPLNSIQNAEAQDHASNGIVNESCLIPAEQPRPDYEGKISSIIKQIQILEIVALQFAVVDKLAKAQESFMYSYT